jgi:molybdate transport system substrate-binding protein
MRARWLALAAGIGCASPESEVLDTTVAAAASLRVVMPDLVAAYEAEHPGARIVVTYGPSGGLRQQIEGGSPVDLVAFASREPVDSLVASGLVDVETVASVATNELVLIGPRAEGAARWTFATLHELPEGARVAVGEPGAVPAGRYAVDGLTALGTWAAIEPRVVYGGDVSMVLAYARRGEVEAAVVYGTDAASVDDVVVLDRATGAWAPRPEVVVGRTVLGADDPHAVGFLAFLGSAVGQERFAARGFGPPLR